MFNTFKSTSILLFTSAFLHFINAQEISLKPVMQAIPSIDSTYSVVHTQIYPKSNDDKFEPRVPSDFYVQKALKKKNIPKIETVNIQQQNIPIPPTTGKKNQQEKTKKSQIQIAALAENNKQPIKWAISPPNPLSSFVVENGVQHDIAQAIPLQAQTPPIPQISQEGALTGHPTSIVTEAISVKPQNQQLQTKSSKEQRSSQTSKTSNLRQQNKPISNNQLQTPQAKPEKHSSNLPFIFVGVLILVLVYVIVRSQRKSKVSSLSILHSRLESYKIEHEDEDLYSFSKSKTSLQQDEGSDEQNQSESIHIYRNKNSRLP